MGDSNKGNKLIVILLIVTIVLVVGLASFFGYMMLVKKPVNSNSNSNQTTKKETIITIELKEFIVNLADDEGGFVKVTISLGYTNKKLETEITENMSIIRDAINKKLMEKKSSDFKENGGLEKIQEELKASINPVLTKGQITNVYFSDIVIQ